MNFNAVILILAGIAEIARFAEKLAHSDYMETKLQRSERSQRRHSDHDRWDKQNQLLSPVSDRSDRSDRKLKVNPVFTHRVSAANLTLVTISFS